MQELGPAPETLTPQQIIARWGEKGGALDQLIEACRDPQHEFERLIQIRKATYNWRMVLGDQFIAPGFTSDWTGQELVDFVSVDSLPDAQQSGSQVAFSYPFNVVGGDCYKFVAVMGQSAPRVKAVPDDPASQDSLKASGDADAVLRDAWIKLLIDRNWRIIAFHQYTTGPAFIHTPYVTDAAKYGQSVEPKIVTQQIEQPDGTTISVPQQAGVETYPNGDAEFSVHSILDVTVPYGTKTIEECGWLILEYMLSKFKLLEMYPEQLEEYRNGDVPDDEMGASVVAANTSRESVSNPSGIGRPKKNNDWRFRQVFVDPWMMEAIKDIEPRSVMKRQYPNGLCITKVGNVTVDLADRPKNDEWAVVKTGRGEKIIEPPICNDSVPIQRALNDLANLAVETVLRAIAKTVVDQMLIDRKSIASNEALPAEIIFTTTAVGTDISKMIAQIPPARVSDQLVPLYNLLRATMQDITGIRPEISGGGVPTQTFREAKQRKEQALAQLSPQAQEMQFGAEAAARNIIRQRAKYGSGTVKSQRKTAFGSQTDVVDLASLETSGWHCEADDNFPITTADTFDKLWGLLKEFPPEVQQALSLLDPMNLERNLELLQLPGYESVYEDQKKKTLEDIQQLLTMPPIESPDPNGQPQKQSPIQPDQYDDHAFVADFVRKWMLSNDGRKAKAENPQTFESVDLFQQAHAQAAQPPAPPAPPAVRTNLNVSAKLEDMGPDFTTEVMQGAGLPGNAQPPAPPQPAPGPQDQGLPAPAPAEQESPIAPVPEGPPDISGPQPAPQMLQ